MPHENTICHFSNRLTEAGTLERVVKAFDWQRHKKGYIPMSGQIVDASLMPAPRQRNTDDEDQAIKAGKTAREIWPNEPNKAAQKDVDARWTLKIGGKPMPARTRQANANKSSIRARVEHVLATRKTVTDCLSEPLDWRAPKPNSFSPILPTILTV